MSILHSSICSPHPTRRAAVQLGPSSLEEWLAFKVQRSDAPPTLPPLIQILQTFVSLVFLPNALLGAHEVEASVRDITTYVDKTLYDQDWALGRYEQWLKVLEVKRRRDAGESLDPKNNASNTSQVCNRRV
ncbi:hypothetical protein JMJ35_007997 [Cladonia borealis]|uniref:Uncharacterized protein n=1 Tax=Cladonia borealis TaxID=184061 RepID=A0AA39QXM0_9LECA|nr:hypothetical protein JMJ35_007997 [Cladonia borealis]